MAIHLYYGDGKGKTTAAMGLAARTLGHDKRVVIVQFLKSGKSGEISSLEKLGARVYAGKAGSSYKVSDLTAGELAENRRIIDKNLDAALREEYDVIILDELCAALRYGLVDEELLKPAILSCKATYSEIGKEATQMYGSSANAPKEKEAVITGRNPQQWLLDIADYITEMKCERHIHDRGVSAREGIEY